ncbi:hypothetical protein [Paenibacillus oceani]|uniref:Uncharacterized protein n=1 Tax=Paenibacillus oceani TaxID=2772510 RepID=A0A927H1C0_9BACL|nr:hypothetical protein [Paenibacillus oceani]MBD2865006.1 hypothetical protein [Paenibacillus oceani]
MAPLQPNNARSRARLAAGSRRASLSPGRTSITRSALEMNRFASGIAGKYGFNQDDYIGRLSLVFKHQRELVQHIMGGSRRSDPMTVQWLTRLQLLQAAMPAEPKERSALTATIVLRDERVRDVTTSKAERQDAQNRGKPRPDVSGQPSEHAYPATRAAPTAHESTRAPVQAEPVQTGEDAPAAKGTRRKSPGGRKKKAQDAEPPMESADSAEPAVPAQSAAGAAKRRRKGGKQIKETDGPGPTAPGSTGKGVIRLKPWTAPLHHRLGGQPLPSVGSLARTTASPAVFPAGRYVIGLQSGEPASLLVRRWPNRNMTAGPITRPAKPGFPNENGTYPAIATGRTGYSDGPASSPVRLNNDHNRGFSVTGQRQTIRRGVSTAAFVSLAESPGPEPVRLPYKHAVPVSNPVQGHVRSGAVIRRTGAKPNVARTATNPPVGERGLMLSGRQWPDPDGDTAATHRPGRHADPHRFALRISRRAAVMAGHLRQAQARGVPASAELPGWQGRDGGRRAAQPAPGILRKTPADPVSLFPNPVKAMRNNRSTARSSVVNRTVSVRSDRPGSPYTAINVQVADYDGGTTAGNRTRDNRPADRLFVPIPASDFANETWMANWHILTGQPYSPEQLRPVPLLTQRIYKSNSTLATEGAHELYSEKPKSRRQTADSTAGLNKSAKGAVAVERSVSPAGSADIRLPEWTVTARGTPMTDAGTRGRSPTEMLGRPAGRSGFKPTDVLRRSADAKAHYSARRLLSGLLAGGADLRLAKTKPAPTGRESDRDTAVPADKAGAAVSSSPRSSAADLPLAAASPAASLITQAAGSLEREMTAMLGRVAERNGYKLTRALRRSADETARDQGSRPDMLPDPLAGADLRMAMSKDTSTDRGRSRRLAGKKDKTGEPELFGTRSAAADIGLALSPPATQSMSSIAGTPERRLAAMLGRIAEWGAIQRTYAMRHMADRSPAYAIPRMSTDDRRASRTISPLPTGNPSADRDQLRTGRMRKDGSRPEYPAAGLRSGSPAAGSPLQMTVRMDEPHDDAGTGRRPLSVSSLSHGLNRKIGSLRGPDRSIKNAGTRSEAPHLRPDDLWNDVHTNSIPEERRLQQRTRKPSLSADPTILRTGFTTPPLPTLSKSEGVSGKEPLHAAGGMRPAARSLSLLADDRTLMANRRGFAAIRGGPARSPIGGNADQASREANRSGRVTAADRRTSHEGPRPIGSASGSGWRLQAETPSIWLRRKPGASGGTAEEPLTAHRRNGRSAAMAVSRPMTTLQEAGENAQPLRPKGIQPAHASSLVADSPGLSERQTAGIRFAHKDKAEPAASRYPGEPPNRTSAGSPLSRYAASGAEPSAGGARASETAGFAAAVPTRLAAPGRLDGPFRSALSQGGTNLTVYRSFNQFSSRTNIYRPARLPGLPGISAVAGRRTNAAVAAVPGRQPAPRGPDKLTIIRSDRLTFRPASGAYQTRPVTNGLGGPLAGELTKRTSPGAAEQRSGTGQSPAASGPTGTVGLRGIGSSGAASPLLEPIRLNRPLPAAASQQVPAAAFPPTGRESALARVAAPLEHKLETAAAEPSASSWAEDPAELDYRRTPQTAAPPAAETAREEAAPALDLGELQEMVKKLPQFDIKKIADRVYREIEKKIRFDRQTRGL